MNRASSLVRGRALIGLGLLVVAGTGIALLFGTSRASHMARYLCHPVPDGVREVMFASSDRLGLSMNWATIIAIQAPTNAMEFMIRTGAFQPSSVDFAATPWRSQGWPVPPSLGADARAYFRVHRPTRGGRGLPLAANRRWSEVLVVDGTGTNGYFAMWATD